MREKVLLASLVIILFVLGVRKFAQWIAKGER